MGRSLEERWIAGSIYRLELHAGETGAALDDHACTLLAAVAGERAAAFAEIGDGAIVLSVGEDWNPVFRPQHGELANTTNFIASAQRFEALEFAILGEPVEEIALFTDGLESLVLHKAAKAVHAPFFDSVFLAVRRSTASGVDVDLAQALDVHLSSAPVDDRTGDDKTLVLASRRPA